RISPPWGGRVIIDLNGHTITSSATNLFEEQRAGVILVGEGSVIHTGTGNFFNASSHGYGDGNQRLIVGKDVTISTNGTLLNFTNNTNSIVPIHIFGKASCSKLCNISTLNHNLDVKINAKELVVTGDTFMTVGKFGENGNVSIEIISGVIKLSASANTKDYWNNANSAEQAPYFSISILGGTFNNGIDVIPEYIVEGYKASIFEIDGQQYANVVDNSECEHNYQVTSSTEATCLDFASKTYICSLCEDTYTVYYGDLAEHKWELTSDKEPTQTSVGERVYTCEVCSDTKTETYYIDITNAEIKVTVNTENGEKEISVKVSDIFVLEKLSENQYKLTDLKDFSEYVVADIVSISIPLGITEINFASNNSTLKKLVFDNGAKVKISSFSKCTALTHIEIGASQVEFIKGCSNSVIKSIKSEVEGANVFFDTQVFDNKKSVTELKLSSNSKYVFGANSFRYTNITEFIAPDYSDVTFKNEAAFYMCNSLKYIYIGRGIKYLEGKPFDYCQYVEKVVLMDVVKITMEWTFCVQNMAEKPVEYYIHSDTISLPNNTFGQSKGIVIYTNAPITNGSAFSSCTEKEYNGELYPAYTIYYGIPHKLEKAYD
ncbi:MAG: leucine-rich repeat protein, partial [Clostridia bacterium]|nr:leucine-rich repeat protein [Clostridia bacterium]